MEQAEFTPNSSGTLVPVNLNMRAIENGVPLLRPVSAWAFVPNPLPPTLDWKTLKYEAFDLIADTMNQLGRLDGLHKSHGRATPLVRALWLREAKLSSAVENIYTTAVDMFLASMNRGEGDVRDRGREAWNYVRALEYGIASKLPLSTRLIREMHEILLTGVDRGPGEPDARPGSFRDIQVVIGQSGDDPRRARFVPPPPGETLIRCLSDFERFANSPFGEIHPLIAIAIMHYQFEAIHPFRDGNGRIGRVIISRSLVSNRLVSHPVVYLSAYIYRNKAAYNDGLLRVSTHGDWTPFIRFMLEAISTQAADAVIRTERLVELREHFNRVLVTNSESPRLQLLVDHLFHTPVVNASEAKDVLNVDISQVYKDLATLERYGIIAEITGKKRDRDWAARAILRLIDDDEIPQPIS